MTGQQRTYGCGWRSLSMLGFLALWLQGCGGSEAEDSCRSVGPHAGVVAQPIVGGSEEQVLVPLNAAQRASVVLLRPRVMTDLSPLCTATYVTPKHALTAAHCLAFDDSLLEGTALHAVVAAHRHPTLDLALLEVGDGCSEVQPQPLRLAEAGMSPQVADPVVIAGYGRTEDDTFGALRFAVEPVVRVEEELLRVDGQGQSGACDGDSGGPLLIADGDGEPRLAGTLSAGAASCRGIDEYVRVTAAADWQPLRDAVGWP